MTKQELRAIKNLKDLQLAKYKLKLKIDYSQHKLKDKSTSFKSGLTFGNVLNTGVHQVMGNSGESDGETENSWMQYLPFVVSAMTSMLAFIKK